MNQQLQKLIHAHKNKQNLKIKNQIFLNEIIKDEQLIIPYFEKSNFTNINFINIRFESSFFNQCSFENCKFDNISLRNAQFESCNLINCNLINCNLRQVDFTRTTFDKCEFKKLENGSLLQGWFESCHFIETNFNDFDAISLIQTALVDSKFTKFQKSIEFKGEFFLLDILESKNGIQEMFIE